MNKIISVSATFAFYVVLSALLATFAHGQETSAMATNPIIWADVPDPAVIRVGDTYYMSSTTMHMSPGLPIMKSADLVNWELIGNSYDTLEDNDSRQPQWHTGGCCRRRSGAII